jgi:hypothetical protein
MTKQELINTMSFDGDIPNYLRLENLQPSGEIVVESFVSCTETL